MSNPDPAIIAERLSVLRTLLAPTGLFLASAQGVSTGYDKAWLRDNFYTALGFARAGEWGEVRAVYRAILEILKKHEAKIASAARERPFATYQYIHARYNPETFDEYWEEWGNKQNDAVGAILFGLGMLEEAGQSVIENDDDRRMIQRLVDYLAAIEYWKDPDNGMWEEYEEVHASSIGACIAGLRSVLRFPFVVMPEHLIPEGEKALASLLPRESATKFCDLALLSLMYPYHLLPRELEDSILSNLEYHLVKERGIIRYKTDRYFNNNSVDGWSEEAEWTMGLAWLAIIFARRKEKERAEFYLKRMEQVIYEGKYPELYFSHTMNPNVNNPLGWAESLMVVAYFEVAALS